MFDFLGNMPGDLEAVRLIKGSVTRRLGNAHRAFMPIDTESTPQLYLRIGEHHSGERGGQITKRIPVNMTEAHRRGDGKAPKVRFREEKVATRPFCGGVEETKA